MSFLYFVLMGQDEIKIGKSDDVPERLKRHRSKVKVYGIGAEVKLLAAIVGGVNEKHVQRYFVGDAVQRKLPGGRGQQPEHFDVTLRLTNYIRWLRNQWFVAIDEDGIGGIVGEAQSFEVWSPNSQRQVHPRPGLITSGLLDFWERVVECDDYYTNRKVMECVRECMGKIDIDPASHPEANRWVKACKFITIHHDGLKCEWYGKVWVCPTFAEWGRWVPKVVSEWNSGRVDEMCLMCPSRKTTNKYWAPILDIANAVCFIKGRRPSEGKGTDSPDDGHCVFYLGARVDRFVKVFQRLGDSFKACSSSSS